MCVSTLRKVRHDKGLQRTHGDTNIGSLYGWRRCCCRHLPSSLSAMVLLARGYRRSPLLANRRAPDRAPKNVPMRLGYTRVGDVIMYGAPSENGGGSSCRCAHEQCFPLHTRTCSLGFRSYQALQFQGTSSWQRYEVPRSRIMSAARDGVCSLHR